MILALLCMEKRENTAFVLIHYVSVFQSEGWALLKGRCSIAGWPQQGS